MSADFSCIPCAGKGCYELKRERRQTCAQERHLCPYQVEINEDKEWLCRCCPECTQECRENI